MSIEFPVGLVTAREATLLARPGRVMRLRLLLITALGVALALYVLNRIGLHAVFATAASVGGRGLALLCAPVLLVFVIYGMAWCVLVPPGYPARGRIALRVFVCARMLRDAASDALPFSQLGGMMLGIRSATRLGMPMPLAIGSLVGDVTVELLSQLLYAATGLFILNAHAHTPAAHALVKSILGALGVAVVAALLFIAVQRHGLRWAFSKMAARIPALSVAHATQVTALLQEIYRRPGRFVVSLLLHLCGWIGGGFGTWLGFRLLGVQAGFAVALAIDSLVYAARSATFLIPNGIGVQEAAFAVLGPLVGIGREFALALSLLKRARDLAVDIPILLLWQLYETRSALSRRAFTLTQARCRSDTKV